MGLALAGSSISLRAQDPDGPLPGAPEQPHIEVSDRDAMIALGYTVSKRMKLDIGFSEDEVSWMLEGIRLGAVSDDQPEHYELSLAQAERIFRRHMASQTDMRRSQAEINAKAGQDFVKSIEQSEGLMNTASGLYYKVIEAGDQDKIPGPTDRVKVNYVGSLIDGKVFDKSSAPVEFAVNGVVPGFGEGLQLIGEGGKVRLYIPSRLGYDINPPPGSSIKAGDMLVFDVELVGVTQAVKRTPQQVNRPRVAGAPPSELPPPPPPPNVKVPPMPKTPPPSTPPPPLPDEAFKKKAEADAAAAESK